MFSVKIFDEDVNNFDKTLLISTTKPCKEIVVNPIAIAEESLICAKTNNKTLFKLSFRLKNNCIKGYYGIPIQLKFENPKEVICTMFRLELQSIGSLPSRVFLENFAKPVEQEGDLLSGAAIAQLLMAQYGKN